MTESNIKKPWDQQLASILIRPFNNTFLHPNHLTTLTLLLGFSTFLIFTFHIIQFAWLGALLYMLAVFSDHLDGELARMSGRTSTFGHHFDYIVGGINYTLLFTGLGIGLSANYGLWALILGLLAGLSNPFILYLRMQMENKFGDEAVKHPARFGFELEDFIYLIGPICWVFGIIYFFIPFAAGNIIYLFWTVFEYRKQLKNR